jgi:hypothetical protein
MHDMDQKVVKNTWCYGAASVHLVTATFVQWLCSTATAAKLVCENF